MNHLSRRSLLAAVSLAALSGSLPALAQSAPDLTRLNEPPAHGEHPMGVDTAKVTIIEYASASCPHCAEFNNTVLPLLKKDYIDTGKVRFLVREFPHNDAGLGAFMVARCAPAEKYHPILDVIFKTQDKWLPNPLAGLKDIALQAGFTEKSFTECLNNRDVAKQILDERKRAEEFGVSGIPYIFINGVHHEGDPSFEALKAKIDPLLG